MIRFFFGIATLLIWMLSIEKALAIQPNKACSDAMTVQLGYSATVCIPHDFYLKVSKFGGEGALGNTVSYRSYLPEGLSLMTEIILGTSSSEKEENSFVEEAEWRRESDVYELVSKDEGEGENGVRFRLYRYYVESVSLYVEYCSIYREDFRVFVVGPDEGTCKYLLSNIQVRARNTDTTQPINSGEQEIKKFLDHLKNNYDSEELESLEIELDGRPAIEEFLNNKKKKGAGN